MADSGGGGLTKSQKKNLRRKGKKDDPGDDTQSNSTSTTADPIEDIRRRLAEAKVNKDHALANQLRQELWIAQDLAAGYKPQIDEEDVKGQALLKSVQGKAPSQMGSSQKTQLSSSSTTTAVTTVSVVGDPADEKKLKSLKKKLAQIEALKKKRDQGEKLEQNQLKKIETEAELREDIAHVEELLSIPMKR